jgi:hypothetical protein
MSSHMTTSQLIDAAVHDARLRAALLIVARDDKSGAISSKRLGWWLKRGVDKIADGLKLCRSNKERPPRWVIRKPTRRRNSRDAVDVA